MKKIATVSLCVLFSLMFCFNCLGYAALTANLTVEGTATWTMPEGVFIQSVSDVTGLSDPIYNSTTLSTDMTAASGSVTITFFNNSEYDYIFDGVVFIEEGGYNTDLTVTTDKDDLNDNVESQKAQKIIKQGESLVIEATYTGSAGLPTVVNYQFVPTDEYVDKVAIDSALARFGQILNEEYAVLDGIMNQTSLLRNDTTFIGNVSTTSTLYKIASWLLGNDDTDNLSSLFTKDEINYLNMEINGETVEVTALITREDMNTSDNQAYDRYVIYLTPETIDQRNTYLVDPVYAAVFDYNSTTNKWVQHGGLYEGCAISCTYSGLDEYGFYNFNESSIEPSTWVSKNAYYGAPSGSTITTITEAYDNQ